jgi:hypothetical protein
MKKLRKLMLKKETMATLNDYSQSRIIGGDYTLDYLRKTLDYIGEYAAGMNSHYNPGDCIKGYVGTDYSYCQCETNANTCTSNYSCTCGSSCC